MENKRGIFISTTSQILVRLLGLVVSLVSIKLLTTAYGSAGTGIYNTITTYLTFSVVLADLGIFSAGVREIAKNPTREREIIGNILTLRLLTAALAAAAAVYLITLTHYPLVLIRGVEITGIFIFFNLVASSFDIIFQYHIAMYWSALAELLSKLVTLLAFWLAIHLDAGFVWAVASIPVSGLAILLFKALFSRKLLIVRPRFDVSVITWILRLSLPLGAVYIIDNLYFKIDTLVLFALKGAVAVGIYSVAYKVLEVTVFIGSYFASSLKPSLARDQAVAERIVNRSLIVMLLLSLPIAAISSVFAQPIILFLSNTTFLGGVKALELLAWTLPFIYCDVLLGEVLIARDARRLLLLIASGSLVFNLILDFLLIPRYSYEGAAIATVTSEVVLLIVNLICCHPFLRIQLAWQTIGKLLLTLSITIGVGIIFQTLGVYFILGIAASFIAYLGAVFGLQIIPLPEIKKVLSRSS